MVRKGDKEAHVRVAEDLDLGLSLIEIEDRIVESCEWQSDWFEGSSLRLVASVVEFDFGEIACLLDLMPLKSGIMITMPRRSDSLQTISDW